MLTDRYAIGVKLGQRGKEVWELPLVAVRNLKFMVPVFGTTHVVGLEAGKRVEIPRSGAWSELRTFVNGISKIPIEARMRTESVGLSLQDPACAAMASHVRVQQQRGRMDAGVAHDLCARVALLDRAIREGRGWAAGAWTSPVSEPDLVAAFVSLLGVPISQAGSARLFRLPAHDRAPSVLLSNIVGLASVAAFGFGWLTLPGSEPPTVGRARVQRETEGTRRRVAIGWDTGTDAMLALSREEIDARYSDRAS